MTGDQLDIRPSGVYDFPGFESARRHLKSCGAPYAWVDYVVDPNEPGATFVKEGKPGYRSQCPHYEGYWLLGGRGSVQCSIADRLIPGLHWYLTCSQDHEVCPFKIGE